MAHFNIHVSSSNLSSSITTNTIDLASRSSIVTNAADADRASTSCGTHKRKCRQQETNNTSSLLDLSSYPNQTNVCLHLSLSFCNCIQIAKKQKLAHQETNVDVSLTVGTSSNSSKSCGNDLWKIKKVLTVSDLGNNSRLLLKKELARKWVVPFVDKDEAEKDGVKVPVFDVDTQDLRSLVFKIWPSNGSHVFIDTWIKDFVGKRNLQEGDEIGLKWDQHGKKFDFSVLRRC